MDGGNGSRVTRDVPPFDHEFQRRDSPDEENPWCGCEVGLLSSPVDFTWAGNGVDVGAQEQEVNEYVYDLSHELAFVHSSDRMRVYLKKDAVLPRVGHVKLGIFWRLSATTRRRIRATWSRRKAKRVGWCAGRLGEAFKGRPPIKISIDVTRH